MNCSKCGFSNDSDAEFCENCGSPLSLFCGKCGALLKPGVKFCKKCGAPAFFNTEHDRLAALQQAAPPALKEKIRSASLQVEGERKPVTILFTDIVGSTALAEKLDPEEWKEIVTGAHQRVSQAVYRYEGTIAQLLGDGVLAFFGAPVTHEDDALRAVLAALDIQDSIVDYERQLLGYVESFKMRVGLNSGLVVVGNVGSDLHMEYLAIGDAVNLAARLQSAAEPGKILVSQSTARLVQAAFNLIPLGEISVKGKRESVPVFEVGERKAVPESRRGFEELRSPLVGRAAELEALHQAMQQLGSGLGQIVSISGEAGIGKSRLVEEARIRISQEWLAGLPSAQRSFHWLEGRSLSYGQRLSFWTIRQLIQDDLGLSDGDPEVKLRLALRRRVQALFGESSNKVLPYLGNLLGTQLEGEFAETIRLLDGETLKHQTLLSIASYFSRLAEEQPVVLVFDDMHWADPSSLETLEHLMPLTDRVPIMLLLISRLEREHPSWQIKLKAGSQYAHRYTEIALQSLSGGEQNRMVDNLLTAVDMPVDLRERILERAEGNPLFLEEIVRDLIEQEAIIPDEKGWRTTGDIVNITIPETLRGVMLSRIDRLQEDVRRTLQLASVIGKSFIFRLLEAIAEAEEQLEFHLAQLQRADLVREKARLPELEYMFKHSITQEAAYNSLLLEQRREFHRQVGQALENLFADRQEEFIGLLAYHFDAAEDIEKATSYSNRAGDIARLTDELSEAVGYYQRAIELLTDIKDDRRCSQVWLKLGLVYHANFQFEATYRAYENAFSLKRKGQTPVRMLMSGPGKTLRTIGEPPRSDHYDPGKASYLGEDQVIKLLFNGLARVDDEMNVIPDLARSWQVLDGGRRYLFYLRDDARWTDGEAVIASDFVWAWKRNLHPSNSYSYNTHLLYAVSGAQDYHEGRNQDQDGIGVRALDALTLEVKLIKPVAFFPYIIAHPVSYPLHRRVVESFGDDWWKPEHIISNGAFRLVEFDPESGYTLERNPEYYGEIPGNIQRIERKGSDGLEEIKRAYLEDRVDVAYARRVDIPVKVSPEERYDKRTLFTSFLLINPFHPPFDDWRVRQALSLALNRAHLSNRLAIPLAYGGIIPPGMAGHSPDIGLHYDPETARRLLAEAGYPGGQGLPVFKGITYIHHGDVLSEIISQWQAELGLQIEVDISQKPESQMAECSFGLFGWVADFPDPDNFLHQAIYSFHLGNIGWQDQEIDDLLETAASLSDRNQRMAIYRRVDRMLVIERALVLPMDYARGGLVYLVKPWVKNFKVNLIGHESIGEVIIEDH
jgi:ABC-type oligopeptide transport system substrate-binding subunit/class 3 adenylate cyclase